MNVASELLLRRKVSIKQLKTFVLDLPRDSRLREIILAENDELEVSV